MATKQTAPRRGRPRDPGVEDRVFDAAITAYGDTGWSGFTLDAVARAAGVGREAIYRRWSGKAQLLAQAVHARSPVLEEVDSGSSRADLAFLAKHFLDSYRETVGVVGLRMVLDARTLPELAEEFTAIVDGTRLARTRRVVTRAMARGDLPAGTNVTAVVEALVGATLAHVLFSAPGPSPAADARHVQRLVRLLMGAP
jgi:AcrR family transcriptional regulator